MNCGEREMFGSHVSNRYYRFILPSFEIESPSMFLLSIILLVYHTGYQAQFVYTLPYSLIPLPVRHEYSKVPATMMP